MQFKLESYFNPHLSPGGTRMDAVLTVTAEGETAGSGGPRCVAFILDASASMFDRNGKIDAAKHALRRCIGMLDASVQFCVVVFGTEAHLVNKLEPATDDAKARVDRLVQRVGECGGTFMSKALALARAELQSVPDAIHYAYFLTDGVNQGESVATLEKEIKACEGKFQCDCRGIGTDWRPDELRKISNALLGTADAVPDPTALAEDFRAALGRALSKGTGGVRLDLWQPATSRLVSLHQMQPENVEITRLGLKTSERVTAFALGAWGREARDYHAVFEIGGGETGDEMLVCRPSIVWDENGAGRKAAGQPVIATWSEDAGLTARISPEVAHYTGQAELADSIREGLEARDRGNVETATRLLGKAARIASESGNEEVTRRLAKVVDVVNAAEGTVRLRRGIGKAETLELEMGGTRTVRRAPSGS